MKLLYKPMLIILCSMVAISFNTINDFLKPHKQFAIYKLGNVHNKEQVLKQEQELLIFNDEYADKLNGQVSETVEVQFNNFDGNNAIKDGWVSIGDDDKVKVTIKVKGNCTSLDMFMAPTGTDAYELRKLVHTITNKTEQKEFEYIWNVPKGTMGHFWVIAYNKNDQSMSESFNIYNE